MADINELFGMANQGRFAELEAMGQQIGGGPSNDKKEGWMTASCFGKAHFFRRTSASGICDSGRVHGWVSVCGEHATSTDRWPMFSAGSYQKCKKCLKKDPSHG